MKTIQELRQQGYKIRVIHHRVRINGAVCRHGGITQVDVRLPNYDFDYTGFSVCRPDEAYNRKHGVKIALGRALLAHNGTVDKVYRMKTRVNDVIGKYYGSVTNLYWNMDNNG